MFTVFVFNHIAPNVAGQILIVGLNFAFQQFTNLCASLFRNSLDAVLMADHFSVRKYPTDLSAIPRITERICSHGDAGMIVKVERQDLPSFTVYLPPVLKFTRPGEFVFISEIISTMPANHFPKVVIFFTRTIDVLVMVHSQSNSFFLCECFAFDSLASFISNLAIDSLFRDVS